MYTVPSDGLYSFFVSNGTTAANLKLVLKIGETTSPNIMNVGQISVNYTAINSPVFPLKQGTKVYYTANFNYEGYVLKYS